MTPANVTQPSNTQIRFSTQDYNVHVKCPHCDSKRTGVCKHPGILNLKGNLS